MWDRDTVIRPFMRLLCKCNLIHSILYTRDKSLRVQIFISLMITPPLPQKLFRIFKEELYEVSR